MKLLSQNKKIGTIEVQVEVADDLWYLHTILEAGDLVTGDSTYKEKLSASDAKAQVAKRRVWVQLQLEKTEFSRHVGHLRISGTVVDGSEEVPRGSHHGFDVEEGSRLTIAKQQWLAHIEQRLADALNSSKLQTLLVLFDRDTAIFSMLKPHGYDSLLTLHGDVPRKGMDERKQHSFYQDIVHHIADLVKRHGVHHVVAASPSFWKEYLSRELTDDLRTKVIFSSVSAVDESAIPELLMRPELQQALQGERIARESAIVERMLEALGKDKLIYGVNDVREALDAGNMSEVLVSELSLAKAKEEERFAQLEEILKKASDMGASVHVFSTEDAMRKLDGLGGVAGMRRW